MKGGRLLLWVTGAFLAFSSVASVARSVRKPSLFDLQLSGMTADLVLALGEKGIKTLDDLGDLATDELLEMLPQGLLDAADSTEELTHPFQSEVLRLHGDEQAVGSHQGIQGE